MYYTESINKLFYLNSEKQNWFWSLFNIRGFSIHTNYSRSPVEKRKFFVRHIELIIIKAPSILVSSSFILSHNDLDHLLVCSASGIPVKCVILLFLDEF